MGKVMRLLVCCVLLGAAALGGAEPDVRADVPAAAPAKPTSKPFIMVVKTDQTHLIPEPPEPVSKEVPVSERMTIIKNKPEEKEWIVDDYSDPSHFLLPLDVTREYDFTVDWGDGVSEVIKRPGSPLLARQLEEVVNVSATSEEQLDIMLKAREREVNDDTKNKMIADKNVGNVLGRIRKSTKAIIKYESDIKNPSPKVLSMEKPDMTLKDALYSIQRQLKMSLVYNAKEGSITLTHDKNLPSDHLIKHVYRKEGTYTIQIKENILGGFPAIQFNAGRDCFKVCEVSQWGTGTWHSMERAFHGCGNMKITAADSATALTGGVTNFHKAWKFCSSLTDFPLINTAAGTDFSEAWSGDWKLEKFPLLNTAAGTNFRGTWRGCRKLAEFPLLNTAAGTNFNMTWCECSNLKKFPLLDVSAGTDFSWAWEECRSLTEFPLLNTAKGTNFGSAWRDCGGLKKFPLLNTSCGTHFERAWSGCYGLTEFPLVDTSNGINFEGAWWSCFGLIEFPVLNTSNGVVFKDTWYNCFGLKAFPLLDTSNGINFEGAWRQCSNLEDFPLLNTIKGTSFNRAWQSCSGLKAFPLLNMAKGIDFEGAWYGCEAMASFPKINTESGKNFNNAWRECAALIEFPLIDTSRGISFCGAWYKCTSLKRIPLLNLSSMKAAEQCFADVSLDQESYSDLLINLAALNSHNKVVFHGGKSQSLPRADDAKHKLVTEQLWKIMDATPLRVLPPRPPEGEKLDF